MRRLKRVSKSEGLDRVCQYCRYFDNGKCYNKDMAHSLNVGEQTVMKVFENGYTCQVIEETLNNAGSVNYLLDSVIECIDKWNVSNKRREDFIQHFLECYGEFADMHLKHEIDDAVLLCVCNHLALPEEVDGVAIDDPTTFSCKEWM